jgi:hypothetical protein
MKLPYISLVILCLATVLWADSRPLVKVGVMLPISGPLATHGEQAVFWLERAKAEIGQMPTKYRYEFILQDDQFQPKQNAVLMRRLVEVDGARALMTLGSPAGAVVAPYAHRQQVPHLGLGYDSRLLVGDFSFSLINPPEDFIEPLVSLLKKQRITKVAIIGARNASWEPVLRKIREHQSPEGYQVVFEKIHSPDDRDFRFSLQQIPQDAQMLIILAWPPAVEIIGRQYREQKLNIPFMGVGGALLMSSSRGLFDGAMDLYPGDMIAADLITREKTGEALSTGGSSLVGTQAKLLAKAYEEVGDGLTIPSGADIVAYLRANPDIETEIGPAQLGNSNAYSFPINYYRIEGDGLSIVDLEKK